jgi:ABC-2 type transport system ATP-binding protein
VLVSTHYMDEAERCHKLAFIAHGKLLVRGTAAEVVHSQQLSTWSIHGEHLAQFSDQLHGAPGVDQTVVFGSALHATGHDAAALARSVTGAARAAGLEAEPIATGIEDVFIYLMNKAMPAEALS